MTGHSNTTVALDVYALARAYRRVLRPAMPPRPEPAMPQYMHDFNPSIAPLEPVTTDLIGDPHNLSGAAPVMWPHQCRDCFGWVDDPRHS